MGLKYLKPHQIKEAQEDLASIEAGLNSGLMNQRDRGHAVKRKAELEKFLNRGTPPPTTPEDRDRLYKREKELREKIRQNMPPRHHMDRKVPGVVGHHGRWEKDNKDAILEWKDTLRALDPTNEDPDYANIERLRPNMDLGEVRPFRYFSGVDMRGGEVVPEGIPDKEKIEQRIADKAEVAVAEAQEEEDVKEFGSICMDCGKEFVKPSQARADAALRLHRQKKHKEGAS